MLLVYTPFPPPRKKWGGKLRRIMVSVKMVNSFRLNGYTIGITYEFIITYSQIKTLKPGNMINSIKVISII